MFYFLSCCDALCAHIYSLFRGRLQREKKLRNQLSRERMTGSRKTSVVFGSAFFFFFFILVDKFSIFFSSVRRHESRAKGLWCRESQRRKTPQTKGSERLLWGGEGVGHRFMLDFFFFYCLKITPH